jgi:uncharacterized protein
MMSEDKPSCLTRRRFGQQTGLIAGGALMASIGRGHAAEVDGTLQERILGKTGVKLSTFTLGTAPCGQSKSISMRDVADMVSRSLDLGVTSIDTARIYGNAEEGIGLALGNRRKEIFLATKVWADTVDDAEQSLAQSLRLLKTDYVDLLYFHNLGARQVDMAQEPDGVFTWLRKQKELGKTRFVGISGHNLSQRFGPFIESGGVDVALMVLSFVDRFVYRFEQSVLPLARKHNLGVLAMKVFGGVEGGFGNYGGPKRRPQLPAEHLELAVRYALEIPGVTSLNIGVHDAEQVRHNLAMIRRFEPLTEAEKAKAAALGRELAAEWGPQFGPTTEPVAFRHAARPHTA